MIGFVGKRLGAGFVQILAITFLTWGLFYFVAAHTGANPAQRIAGKAASRAQIKRVAHELGTDRPLYQQYGLYLWNLAHGDLGYSYQQRRPVTDIVVPAARTTASLVFGAMVVWLLLAIPVGIAGALWPRSWIDRVLMIVILLGLSTPVFWIAPMLSYFLGYQPTQGRLFGIGLPHPMTLFPIDGYVNLVDNPAGWAYHLALPWLAFALGFAAIYARMIRGVVGEQLSEDYVRTAYAKGASTTRVLRAHVGHVVAPLIVTMIGLDIGVALGGALFVETVFGLPGLGYVGLSSIQNLDYPLTVGVITFAAIAAVAANACADIAHGALDPRVRTGGGGH
jgi:peptide/nickel transport system permease protein